MLTSSLESKSDSLAIQSVILTSLSLRSASKARSNSRAIMAAKSSINALSSSVNERGLFVRRQNVPTAMTSVSGGGDGDGPPDAAEEEVGPVEVTDVRNEPECGRGDAPSWSGLGELGDDLGDVESRVSA